MTEALVKTIQIVGLARESSCFLQLKLTFKTGEVDYLKYTLDKYTYNHLKKVVFPEVLNGRNIRSVCTIPVQFSQKAYEQENIEIIIWDVFGQSIKFSYACSPEYKLFLDKLRKIKDFEEYYETFKQEDTVKKDGDGNHKIFSFLKSITVVVCFGYFFFGLTPTTQLQGKPQLALEYTPVHESEVMAQVNKLADVTDNSLNNDLDGEKGNKELESITDNSSNDPEENSNEESVESTENTGSKEPYSFEEIIRSLPEGQVALTFDDGPSAYTEDILSILKEHDVPATFFFIGANIPKYPHAVVAARDQGHAIGLHSFAHRRLSELSKEKQEQDIDSALQAIEPYVNRVSLFRPPYGSYDNNTKAILAKHRMSLVLWNRDPRDWAVGSSQQIIDYFYDISPSRGIYVLHENALTLEVLPQIISYIKEMGLELVALGQ
ncbi:MAG: polysaccharide deacetylase family protein [Zhaonellaceae bacterium]|jgi:peptidoglycan/xylan/chitin deacetylase (PgdA/CDA1 family)